MLGPVGMLYSWQRVAHLQSLRWEIALDFPGGPMESQGSLEVEEEEQERVKGLQCEPSAFIPGFAGLDGGKGREPGKAGGREAGKRGRSRFTKNSEGMQTLPEL